MENINTNLFQYPEKDKAEFLKSSNIVLRDGTVITPQEVWDYLTEVGPKKYPWRYDTSDYFGRKISEDTDIPFTLKHNYLLMTMDDRIMKAKKNGAAVAFVQGGQSVDPYYAANTIAVRPATATNWNKCRENGLNLYESEVESRNDKEKAYNAISFEACNTAGYEYVQEGDLPVDIIAPYTCLRCSDVSYGVEAHRHGKRQDVKRFLVDYPMNNPKNKEWAIDYFAENIRKLIGTLDSITGRTTTERDLLEEIKLHNKGRKLAMEIADLWWSAKQPPTNGKDRRDLFQIGGMEMHADPIASLGILEEAKESIRYRVENGIGGAGLTKNPARIFICGSCVFPNEFRMEKAGGIVVGNDNHWSDITTLVEEEGDPYYNLSKAILSYPYEQPIEQRAIWTVEQIKKSRADGVLFLYNWGCNTQSAVSRALVDEIKRLSGVPTMIIEHELNGTQSEQIANRVNAFIEMVS